MICNQMNLMHRPLCRLSSGLNHFWVKKCTARMYSTDSKELLGGVFAPIPTPFNSNTRGEGTSINFDKLDKNLQHWVLGKEKRLDGICVMGSNGEFPLLTFEEKKSLLKHVVSVSCTIV